MFNSKSTILIAEDDENLREMYTMALTNAGFEVLPAVDGREALDLLEKRFTEINLLILDIVMPEMDGFEVLEKIADDSRFNKIPVFVSTNLDNEEDRRKAFGMGALDYYIKSNHTPSELVNDVKGVIATQEHLPRKINRKI